MKIVILGAGAVGVMSAFWLRRDGHDVTVVERRSLAGMETSWGNGGILHPSAVDPWSAPGMAWQVFKSIGDREAPILLHYRALPRLTRWGLAFLANSRPKRFHANFVANLTLALESVAAMQKLRQLVAPRYDQRFGAVLKIFGEEAAYRAALAKFTALSRYGLEHEPLNRAACLARAPALTGASLPIAGGIHFPQDEIGDCPLFTQAVAAWCDRQGVDFRYDTVVQRIATHRGRATGIVTDRGPIAADAVVVSLASESRAMVRRLGVHVPIHPVKGLSITVPRGDWAEAPEVALMNEGLKIAVAPLGDRIRIVGSAEIDGYDLTVAPDRIAMIARSAQAMLPGLASGLASPERVDWAGLRPVVPSGRPIIGPTKVPGLWLNTGHGHAGWTLAAGSGRRLASLMLAHRKS